MILQGPMQVHNILCVATGIIWVDLFFIRSHAIILLIHANWRSGCFKRPSCSHSNPSSAGLFMRTRIRKKLKLNGYKLNMYRNKKGLSKLKGLIRMAATGFYPDASRDSRIVLQHHHPPTNGLSALRRSAWKWVNNIIWAKQKAS
jgi:hypothetical protein